MQVSPPRNVLVQSRLMTRGVPKYLFRIKSFDLNKSIGMYDKGVEPNEQLKHYIAAIKDPLYGPYLYLMCSQHLHGQVGLLALHLFKRAMKAAKDKFPYWYTLKSTNKEPLLEGQGSTYNIVGNPSMMVFDGIISESNALKLERLHDLLLEYSEVPRIVLVAGTDPLTFTKRIHIKPAKVLYLADKKVVEL